MLSAGVQMRQHLEDAAETRPFPKVLIIHWQVISRMITEAVNDMPTSTLNCIVYVPNIYNGTGNTQTLIWMVEHFKNAGTDTIVCFERSWQFPKRVPSVNLFPMYLRWLPGRLTSLVPHWLIRRRFIRLLSKYSPDNTYVYVWPPTRLKVVDDVKSLGFCVFREMINCSLRVHDAEVSLARKNAGLEECIVASAQMMQDEETQLQMCDFVTAPNPEVKRSLQRINIPDDKIIPTSFGWAMERFPLITSASENFSCSQASVKKTCTVLFVGSLEARKGVYYLLEAWKNFPLQARLLLVGQISSELAPLIAGAIAEGSVEHLPFVSDVESIYRAADIFVFPTVEEGGPQVTFEAAGCGLPVITTAMGAAGIIEDGRNGLIIPSHDVHSLLTALLDLIKNEAKRRVFGNQAQFDARSFTYDKVGASRADLFRKKFVEFRELKMRESV